MGADIPPVVKPDPTKTEEVPTPEPAKEPEPTKKPEPSKEPEVRILYIDLKIFWNKLLDFFSW